MLGIGHRRGEVRAARHPGDDAADGRARRGHRRAVDRPADPRPPTPAGPRPARAARPLRTGPGLRRDQPRPDAHQRVRRVAAVRYGVGFRRGARRRLPRPALQPRRGRGGGHRDRRCRRAERIGALARRGVGGRAGAGRVAGRRDLCDAREPDRPRAGLPHDDGLSVPGRYGGQRAVRPGAVGVGRYGPASRQPARPLGGRRRSRGHRARAELPALQRGDRLHQRDHRGDGAQPDPAVRAGGGRAGARRAGRRVAGARGAAHLVGARAVHAGRAGGARRLRRRGRTAARPGGVGGKYDRRPSGGGLPTAAESEGK